MLHLVLRRVALFRRRSIVGLTVGAGALAAVLERQRLLHTTQNTQNLLRNRKPKKNSGQRHKKNLSHLIVVLRPDAVAPRRVVGGEVVALVLVLSVALAHFRRQKASRAGVWLRAVVELVNF